MKSIQIKRYGRSDVMEVNNATSEPNPSSGKILVNVKASGVNPIDWKIREGYMQQMIPLQFPSTLDKIRMIPNILETELMTVLKTEKEEQIVYLDQAISNSNKDN